MIEIWKDITGYEGRYQISNLGKVRSLVRDILLKPALDSKGYPQVRLYNEGQGKSYRVHKLVADHFIPNLDNKAQVNHIDENKLNNNVNNLEWMTNKENMNHGTRNKRAGINISKVKSKPITNGETIFTSVKEAGKLLNISPQAISTCLVGKTKTSGGFSWTYVD